MSVKGLIFDKDGTLFDFAASWGLWADRVLADLSQSFGVPAQLLGARIGYDTQARSFAPDSLVIAGTAAEIVAQLLPMLPGANPRLILDRLNAEAARAPMVPVVPLAPLMARLRARGLRLGVMTNDSEAPAMAHLAAAGVAGVFSPVIGADSGHGAKPDPAPLLACAAAWGLSAPQVAMIGDSRHDLLAGRRAGMVTVGVLTGMASADDLGDLADVILPGIGHLEAWIDG